ncbi:unnamed protein product [Ilex paraguariensis]|uniref:Uncharacterized protein n=1 Tax=Ilex paraguariensis TaxID=185542 RepID=A0ABC8RFN2_9AQUA
MSDGCRGIEVFRDHCQVSTADIASFQRSTSSLSDPTIDNSSRYIFLKGLHFAPKGWSTLMAFCILLVCQAIGTCGLTTWRTTSY